MTILSPALLPLLLIAIVVAIWALAVGRRGRRKTLRDFTGSSDAESLTSKLLRVFRLCLLLGAIVCLGLAIARPAWKKEPTEVTRGGRDVLFLLDVSRSMLAADLTPDRLTSAKRAILDCVDSFEGNRVGLVTFAGSPSTVCPLTTDYGYFWRMVEEASPENVDHGGTRIGDAIRKTVDKLLDPDRAGLQDIVLISDGGDQESQPGDAAAELDEYGVFLIAIGVGDDITGARVPARPSSKGQTEGASQSGGSSFTLHQGKEVWSRLEPAALRGMADAAKGGVYLHAGTRSLALGEVYHDLVRHLQQHNPDMAGETMMRWRDEFPGFLAAALICLLGHSLSGALKDGLRRNRDGRSGNTSTDLAKATSVVVGVLFVGFPSPQVQAEEVSDAPSGEPRAIYNQGVALHADGDLRSAADAFHRAAQLGGSLNPSFAAKAIYNLGRCHFDLATSEPEFLGSPDLEEGDDEAYLVAPDPVVEYRTAARAFRAALDIDPSLKDAAWNLELARLRAEEAAMARDQTNNDQQDPSDEEQEGETSDEGESSESDEDDWGEDGDETDQEGDGTPSDYQSSQSAVDLQNQDIPPPMIDPQELLMEEREHRESREKSRGKQYQPVDKDW